MDNLLRLPRMCALLALEIAALSRDPSLLSDSPPSNVLIGLASRSTEGGTKALASSSSSPQISSVSVTSGVLAHVVLPVPSCPLQRVRMSLLE